MFLNSNKKRIKTLISLKKNKFLTLNMNITAIKNKEKAILFYQIEINMFQYKKTVRVDKKCYKISPILL